MSVVNVVKNTYTVDPLYQWDLNQLLEIRGLSLPTIPEIHFANAAMERAIVRQASMDAAGVVYVEIPNSLLQKPHTINAYVCLYSGETFESLYKFDIPVKARKQPSDYVITDSDDEIYSFNALENLVNNVLTNANAVLANDAVIIAQANTAIKNTETAIAAANKAVADVETVKDGVTNAANAAAAAQKSADDAASVAANKLDPVSGATANNFAGLDELGKLLDSGENKGSVVAAAVEQALAAGLKIVQGTYTGTNTYGSANPSALTFGFEPYIVYIANVSNDSYGGNIHFIHNQSKNDTYYNASAMLLRGGTQIRIAASSAKLYYTFTKNGVSYYGENASNQLNSSGQTYNYLAIGI